MQVSIRNAEAEDLDSILKLFKESIRGLAMNDYTPSQIEAWSANADKEKWLNRISDQHFLLCEADSGLAGFSSITKKGYIDLLFVHPDFSGKGVATRMLARLEAIARNDQCEQIESDVSITAKGVFLVMGYEIISEQLVEVKEEKLKNFKMFKKL